MVVEKKKIGCKISTKDIKLYKDVEKKIDVESDLEELSRQKKEKKKKRTDKRNLIR